MQQIGWSSLRESVAELESRNKTARTPSLTAPITSSRSWLENAFAMASTTGFTATYVSHCSSHCVPEILCFKIGNLVLGRERGNDHQSISGLLRGFGFRLFSSETIAF